MVAAIDNGASGTTNLDFDPKALREKYRIERDKRLTEGRGNFRRLEGEFARLADDPYVEPGFTRAPLTDEVDVVVVGGGFGGLLAGARLREAGVNSIRFIERAGDFGGTWYWNRYPGAACDIESYIYLPLLEETGYVPVEKYARAPEILEHAHRIARKYDLYRDACFQTQVKEIRWDEAASRWVITTNRGDAMKARFICLANGLLDRAKLPAIPGIESFKGHMFHTSRWDYTYTGGTSAGGLTGLKDKRVGIIGTGATAVQCIPHLGQAAKHLYVFQRTPSSVDVRNDRPTDPEWVKSLQPGWQQRRMDNFNVLTSGGHQDEDLVNDGWTDLLHNLVSLSQEGQLPAEELVQLADFKKMEQVRARVDAIVKDKATAEALKPYYNQFCKRPCFHDDYLPTFNRPNVTLVDTQGRGVEAITERGAVANGREYELDCLIFATGFEIGTTYAERTGFEVYGRGGLSLTEKWKDGIATLHGMQTRGFPNCLLFMNNVQSGIAANFTHMLNEFANHAAHIVRQALEKQARAIDVSQEAEAAWVDTIMSLAMRRQKFAEECTPGYYNNEGMPSPLAVRNGPYGGGSTAYLEILAKWRADGGLPGMEVQLSQTPATAGSSAREAPSEGARLAPIEST